MTAVDIIFITVIIIGLLGALIVSDLKTKKIKRDLKHASLELDFSRSAFDFGAFIQEWSSAENQMIKLIEDTSVDRVLILRAWNGQEKPKWTTSVFQMRDAIQAPINYIHTELDTDYVNKLNSLAKGTWNGYFEINKDSGENLINNIYKAEEVKASFWSLIDRKPFEDDTTLICYMSFATTTANKLTPKEILQCKAVVEKIKLAYSIYYENKES